MNDYDVVIVGAGNAGLVSALAAHEEGARVLVLEAAPVELRGGNSRFTGGIFRVVHDGLDDLLSLVTEESAKWKDRVSTAPYTVEEYHRDIDAVTEARAEPDLSRVLVEQSLDVVRWMHQRGVRWELTVGKLIDPDKMAPEEEYALPPGGALRSSGEGVGLVDDLFAAVDRAGVEVWYDAPVIELMMHGSRATGVIVRRPDGDVAVSAGAVVLASGGFESNPQMRQRWLGPGWDLVKVRGTQFNMGVPLEAAMRQGGQPFGHWGGCHAVPLDAHAPNVGDLRYTDKFSRYSYPYSVMVNRAAERFVDEGSDHVWLTYAKTGDVIRSQRGAWAAQIFDQRTIHLLEPRYATAKPVRADTLADLAEALGIDAARFTETIEQFNAACTPGEFDPFTNDGLAAQPAAQPPKSNWAQPIDKSPFVAYEVTCGITFTFGGLRITTEAEVVDVAGRPMPGLYATGEITGGFFYLNYPAGAGLVRGAVFGRIAGRAAAEHASSGA